MKTHQFSAKKNLDGHNLKAIFKNKQMFEVSFLSRIKMNKNKTDLNVKMATPPLSKTWISSIRY